MTQSSRPVSPATLDGAPPGSPWLHPEPTATPVPRLYPTRRPSPTRLCSERTVLLISCGFTLRRAGAVRLHRDPCLSSANHDDPHHTYKTCKISSRHGKNLTGSLGRTRAQARVQMLH